MTRYFSEKYKGLVPYVPGEQPRGRSFIKLNTNESPFPPTEGVRRAVAEECGRLQLYSDTECTELRRALAARLDVRPDELLMTNGSDEILNFTFMAFCDERNPAVFADITYGFYSVFAQINRIPAMEIALREDLRLEVGDYLDAPGTIFIANPNAPTGLALGREEIEVILRGNPNHVVVVDEAYVDFGGESCVPLIREYENLLVTRTFSKSRSLAGARLGFGVANEALIRDLNTVKFSTNPYNVNRMTQAAGLACLAEDEVNQERCQIIMNTRDWTAEALRTLGFDVTDSRTNFLFVRHPGFPGDTLLEGLRHRGILIRHFAHPARIADYNRITIGTEEQMQTLVREVESMLEEMR